MSARRLVSGKYVSNPVFLYTVVHENLDTSQIRHVTAYFSHFGCFTNGINKMIIRSKYFLKPCLDSIFSTTEPEFVSKEGRVQQIELTAAGLDLIICFSFNSIH